MGAAGGDPEFGYINFLICRLFVFIKEAPKAYQIITLKSAENLAF